MICHQTSQYAANYFSMIQTSEIIVNSQSDNGFSLCKSKIVSGQTQSMKISDSYFCLLCNKRFAKKSTYQNHSRIHGNHQTPIYICNICNKSFSIPARLTRHYRTHTGEKPYQCEYCNKSFSVKENLSVHRRIHTKERPYRCDVCHSGFEHSGKLHRHMRIHTGERPHKCSICDKTFIQSGQLVIHMRTHTGEKPYLCKSCGKRFTCSKQLKVHSRTHTGEKPYKCNICGKSFGYNHVLKLHQVAHYGEKFYKCILCQKTFNSKKLMEVHIKSSSNCEILDIAKLSTKTSKIINLTDQMIPYNKSYAKLAIGEMSFLKQNESKNVKEKSISYNVSNFKKQMGQLVHHQSYQDMSKNFIKSSNETLVIENNVPSSTEETQSISPYGRNSSIDFDEFNSRSHRIRQKKVSSPVISSTFQSFYSKIEDSLVFGQETKENSTLHKKVANCNSNLSQIHLLNPTSHTTDSDIIMPDTRNYSNLPPRKRPTLICETVSSGKNILEAMKRCNSVIKFAKIDNIS